MDKLLQNYSWNAKYSRCFCNMWAIIFHYFFNMHDCTFFPLLWGLHPINLTGSWLLRKRFITQTFKSWSTSFFNFCYHICIVTTASRFWKKEISIAFVNNYFKLPTQTLRSKHPISNDNAVFVLGHLAY